MSRDLRPKQRDRWNLLSVTRIPIQACLKCWIPSEVREPNDQAHTWFRQMWNKYYGVFHLQAPWDYKRSIVVNGRH